MNKVKNLSDIVRYWIEKSKDSLDAAKDELKSNRLSFSVNRIYYACFYTVSAVLLYKGYRFKKHSGVRSAFHQHLIKEGLISQDDGKFYDVIFEARQRGDYIELVSFKKEKVEEWLNQAEMFVRTLKRLVD